MIKREFAGPLFEAMFLKQKYYLMKLGSVIMQALLMQWQCHFLHELLLMPWQCHFLHEVLLMPWHCHFLHEVLLMPWQCHFLHEVLLMQWQCHFLLEVLLMQWQCHFLLEVLLMQWQCHFLHAGITYAMAMLFSHQSQSGDDVLNFAGPLFEAVFLEYARFLINLGHGKAASYYCSLAGEKGAQLYKEVCILFNNN